MMDHHDSFNTGSILFACVDLFQIGGVEYKITSAVILMEDGCLPHFRLNSFPRMTLFLATDFVSTLFRREL